ncbi:hypothetical protein [Nitrospirillum viridazoti]|uniref:hypothetical protein n=1 Tax=Nitrospirillum viridazoti TaxID=3144925 RepID=UPI00110FCA79|nr:hypothetical protein [Nitrospirillum amazonense]
MPAVNGYIAIQSEEEAWQLLSETLAGDQHHASRLTGIEIQNWGEDIFTIKNTLIPGAVTSNVLDCISEYQSNLTKAFSSAIYNTDDARKIPAETKRSILIQFYVTPGSTNIGSHTNNIIGAIIKEASKKISGRNLIIFCYVIVLLFFGSDCFKHWIDAHSENEKKKL